MLAIILTWLTHLRNTAFSFVLKSPMALSFQKHYTTPASTTTTTKSNTMPQLPSNVVKYSQVPKKGSTFKKETIPKGLLKQHNTKMGTWGVIRVSSGQLKYQINEPTVSVFILDKDCVGVIEPKIYHQVEALTDDVEFVVEFYRQPGTGPVDEKREGLKEE